MDKKMLLAAFLLVAGFAACDKEQQVSETPQAPKVEFSLAESTLNVKVDDAVEFKATIVEGTNVACVWTVDGEKVASTPSVTWKFTKVGASAVHFEASNDLGKVEKDYTVNVAGIPLEISYSVPEDAVEAVIGTPFTVELTITGGDKQTVHEWKLDGNDSGNGLSFSKTFTEEEIGPHTLVYNGENADGMTATKTWSITVKDLPLEVAFTPNDAPANPMVGDNVKFSAEILHGAAGAAYSWKVNDKEVATTADYSFSCAEEGEFRVNCAVTNGAGEKAEKTWTLTVVPKSEKKLLFDNFESYEVGPGIGSYYIGNVAGGVSVTQVVENPFKTSVNYSDKVLVDKGSIMNQNNTTSGYFKFKINTMPDAVTEVPNRADYTKIRVKIYLGDCGYTPLLQEDNKSTKSAPSEINGIAFDTANPTMDAWNAAIKTNDWNVFVYDFGSSKYSTAVNNLSQTNQVQFRVFVNFNNQNQKPADVYFDDIEFVE